MTGLRIAPPRWGTRALSTEQLVARAQRVRLVLTDCDGVLTDGTVYVSASTARR